MHSRTQTLLKTAHAAWRLLPKTFRKQAMSTLAASLARKPDQPPPSSSPGVIVAGDVDGPNGLAESARIMHQVIAAHGLARGFIPLGLPSVVPVNKVSVPPDAALLAGVNAPILPVGLLRLPRNFIAGRRVIGLWAWELPEVPRTWHDGAKFVHEVWAPSQFSADAVAPLVAGRVRVVPHPLAAVDLPVEGDRASLGLPPDRLIVLTIFNLASSMVRKNPLGAIAAFRAAFGNSPDHLFVLKLSGTEDYPEDLRLIQAAIGNAPNILLLTGNLPEPQLRGLIAAADIVLSLHRSEGFGLIPGTAMLLGRAVVATGWSGNMDFMTPETSALISYRLIPAVDPRGTYQLRGALWADPDIEDAAARLRTLAGDAQARAAMARAGEAHARKMLGAEPVLAALAASGIA
jgi:glycosyltransferase involved in cell wall biosynthesis